MIGIKMFTFEVSSENNLIMTRNKILNNSTEKSFQQNLTFNNLSIF